MDLLESQSEGFFVLDFSFKTTSSTPALFRVNHKSARVKYVVEEWQCYAVSYN